MNFDRTRSDMYQYFKLNNITNPSKEQFNLFRKTYVQKAYSQDQHNQQHQQQQQQVPPKDYKEIETVLSLSKSYINQTMPSHFPSILSVYTSELLNQLNTESFMPAALSESYNRLHFPVPSKTISPYEYMLEQSKVQAQQRHEQTALTSTRLSTQQRQQMLGRYNELKAKYNELDSFIDLPILRTKVGSIVKEHRLEMRGDQVIDLLGCAVTNFLRSTVQELVHIRNHRLGMHRNNIRLVYDAKQAEEQYRQGKRKKIQQILQIGSAADPDAHDSLEFAENEEESMLSCSSRSLMAPDPTVATAHGSHELWQVQTNHKISLMDVLHYLEHDPRYRRSSRLYETYLLIGQKLSNRHGQGHEQPHGQCHAQTSLTSDPEVLEKNFQLSPEGYLKPAFFGFTEPDTPTPERINNQNAA